MAFNPHYDTGVAQALKASSIGSLQYPKDITSMSRSDHYVQFFINENVNGRAYFNGGATASGERNKGSIPRAPMVRTSGSITLYMPNQIQVSQKANYGEAEIGLLVAGAIGGLPIITVIVRSTVNINNNAKTKWSNLYHGILLLAFIFVLTPLITKVPLAALAILLVFTGYKLASPVVFRNVLDQGIEQLIFFIGTLIITLQYDLLIGIFGGLALAALTHFLLAKVTIRQFIQMIFNSGSNLHFRENIGYEMKVKGIANFLGAIKMNSLLDKVPAGSNVNIDLSGARLVDFSIMEKLYDFQKNHANTVVVVMVIHGLVW